MLYLYLKTHNKTGLKYLGKTKRNPYTYQGSGTIWKRHIKKHGYDVTTEILFQSENLEEFKQKCLHYSHLFNIVESQQWANLVVENGVGGSNSRSSKLAWETKRIRGNDIINTPEVIAKCKETKKKNGTDHKEIMNRPEVSAKQKAGLKNKWEDPVFREKQAKHNKTRSMAVSKRMYAENPNDIITVCCYCGKSGSRPGMIRWHGENCKAKKGE